MVIELLEAPNAASGLDQLGVHKRLIEYRSRVERHKSLGRNLAETWQPTMSFELTFREATPVGPPRLGSKIWKMPDRLRALARPSTLVWHGGSGLDQTFDKDQQGLGGARLIGKRQIVFIQDQ